MKTRVPINELGTRLRAERERRHLTYAEAAAELGVSRRLYQSWEWGEVTNPRGRSRRKIEQWLEAAAA